MGSFFSVLSRAGILDKVIEQGFIPADASWRKPNGEWIIGLERLDTLVSGLPHTVILPVGSLSALLLEEVRKLPSVAFHWGQRVLRAGQDGNGIKAWVEVEDPTSNITQRLEADFVIGCDGGSSVVRKSISEFPGSTWPMQLVAVNVSINQPKIHAGGWVQSLARD